jgi:hypothetical protein
MKNTRKRSLSKLQNRLRKINRTIKNTESLVKLGTFSGNVSMLDGFKDERQRLVEHIDTKLLNAAYPELKKLRRKTMRRTISNST